MARPRMNIHVMFVDDNGKQVFMSELDELQIDNLLSDLNYYIEALKFSHQYIEKFII